MYVHGRYGVQQPGPGKSECYPRKMKSLLPYLLDKQRSQCSFKRCYTRSQSLRN